MKDAARLYLQRAENELVTAQVLSEISQDPVLQRNEFMLEEEFTFYSAVISHSYYCIFFSAKAALAEIDVRTDAPDVHTKTLIAFDKRLVLTGMLDVRFLKIYRKLIIRAEHLLQIFSAERRKRGEYTYQKLPQANREPALDSLTNAKRFFKNISAILR